MCRCLPCLWHGMTKVNCGVSHGGRPNGSDWLTSEQLARDMKELHLGDGVVIVWPAAVKQESADDAAEHEARLEARFSRPLKDVIVIE